MSETVGDRLPELILEAKEAADLVDSLPQGNSVFLRMAIERAEKANRRQDVVSMMQCIKELEEWIS